MRAKLREEECAGLDLRAFYFGMVDAYDLVVPVRENTGFSAITQERSRIDTQFRKDTLQGGITEQLHHIDL
jgi:hypothetical protein